MKNTNSKLQRAARLINPIHFDSIKIIVSSISATSIPKGRRLKTILGEHHEFLTIFQGSMSCKIEDKEFTIKEKDKTILCLPPKSSSIFTPLQDSIIFRIAFFFGSDGTVFFKDFHNGINAIILKSGFQFAGHWKLCRLFEKIKTETSNSYPFSEIKISLLVQDFILTFLRIYLTDLKLDNMSFNNIKLMEQVDSFIANNINKKITVKELANVCNLSTRQALRIVQTNRGMSVAKYIQSIKMDAAKEELLNESKTIKKISSDLGYSDIAYFYRCFKKRFGTTPNKARGDDIKT